MITKYNKFINESFFFKTYEEMLKDIDKSYLKMLKYDKSYVHINGPTIKAIRTFNDSVTHDTLTQSLKTIHLTIKLLEKFKNDITKEQLISIIDDILIKIYEVVLGYGTKIADKIHTNLVNGLNHIIKLIVDINKNKNFNIGKNFIKNKDQVVLYEQPNGYSFLYLKSEADLEIAKRAEIRAKYADIDPLGEENWDD